MNVTQEQINIIHFHETNRLLQNANDLELQTVLSKIVIVVADLGLPIESTIP